MLLPLADMDLEDLAVVHLVRSLVQSVSTAQSGCQRLHGVENLPYLVAERDGEVVGYGYATLYRPRPAYRFTVEDSVYVREGMSGLGVGQALLSKVIQRCTEVGGRQMVAIIGNSENVASIRLHERQGFRKVGVFESVGFKHGRWLDTVIMQRELGEGARSIPMVRNIV